MMAYPYNPAGFGCCVPRHWCAPVRQCRREAKELLVRPDTGTREIIPRETLDAQAVKDTITADNITVNPIYEKATSGTGDAIIGGGCCVHLSVEYMPVLPAKEGASPGVRVTVTDSDGARLVWGKDFQSGYHVQENIITTNPGALLQVRAIDAIARVRWCEVFSC